jgi:hypothetical protein
MLSKSINIKQILLASETEGKRKMLNSGMGGVPPTAEK